MGVLNALRDPIGLSLGIGVSRAVFRLRRDGRVDRLVRLVNGGQEARLFGGEDAVLH